MRAYVGITDFDWFKHLRSIPNLEEANFWQPSSNRRFNALVPGELFLFKLHSPLNFIVGGGVLTHFDQLPESIVSEEFKEKTGVIATPEMGIAGSEIQNPKSKIQNLRAVTPDFRIEISKRIKEEFENGKDYYRLQGQEIRKPSDKMYLPSESNLRWHNEERYPG